MRRLTQFLNSFPALFFLFVIFSFCLISCQTAEASVLRINAPKVLLEIKPGDTTAGEILAENPTAEEIKVKIYLEDWVYAPGGTGEKTFTPPGTTSLSAARWITFGPAEDTIKPFGRTTVHYTIAVPPDATGVHYAVLFFETSLGVSTDAEGVNVNVTGRVGSLFYIESKGLAERKGRILSAEIRIPKGNKPFQIVTRFQNMGSTDITLGGKFLIMDAEGKVLGRGDVSNIYTFPGASETGTTEWVGRLPKGSYQALLTYDLGKGKSLVEEKALTIE